MSRKGKPNKAPAVVEPRDGAAMSYDEIGIALGVSRAFANFLGARATRKFKLAMAARGYRGEDFI